MDKKSLKVVRGINLNKNELISKMKTERERWNNLIEKILELKQENEIITKQWILKDVVMDIYIYEQEIKNAIQSKTLKEHHFWSVSYPTKNKEIYLEREKYTLEKLLQLDEENFEELLCEIQQLQDEDTVSQKFFIDSRTKLQTLIKDNSYGHYHDHIAILVKRFHLTDY